MRLIDADALEKEGWSLHRTVRVDSHTSEYQVKPITKVPTIEPERKTGWWIPVMNGRGGHCCNRCNGYAPSYMNGDEHLSDFCPFCGADMRGEQDE